MMLSKTFLVALMAAVIMLSCAVFVGTKGKDQDKGKVEKVEEEKVKVEEEEEAPCPPGKNVFWNAGTLGKTTANFIRTSKSRRMKTTNSIDTSRALEGYKKEEYYQLGRSLKNGAKYEWEDPKYEDSCYSFDIVIGFAELDETYCQGPDGKQRVFSVAVDAGGGWENMLGEEYLNVASETGGCYKAYTVKKTVKPTKKKIQVQFKKAKGDDSNEPMVSILAIKRGARIRYLRAK